MATGFSEPIAEFEYDENGNILTGTSVSNLKLDGTGEFTDQLLESKKEKEVDDIGDIGEGEGQLRSDNYILNLVDDIDELNRAAVQKSQITLDNLHIELGIPADESDFEFEEMNDETSNDEEIVEVDKSTQIEEFLKDDGNDPIRHPNLSSSDKQLNTNNDNEETITEQEPPMILGSSFVPEEIDQSQNQSIPDNSLRSFTEHDSPLRIEEVENVEETVEAELSVEQAVENEEPTNSQQEQKINAEEPEVEFVGKFDFKEGGIGMQSNHVFKEEDEGLLLASVLNNRLNDSEFTFETKWIEDHRASKFEDLGFWNCEEISLSNASLSCNGPTLKVPNPSLCSLNPEEQPLPPRLVFLGNVSEQISSIIYEAERMVEGLSGQKLEEANEKRQEISQLLKLTEPPSQLEVFYSNKKGNDEATGSNDNLYTSREELLRAIVSGEIEIDHISPLTYSSSEGAVGEEEAKAALESVLDRMLLIDETHNLEGKDSPSTFGSLDGKNVLPRSTQELFKMYEEVAKLNPIIETKRKGKLAAIFPSGSAMDSNQGNRSDYNSNFCDEESYLEELQSCKSEDMREISPIVLNEENEEYQANVEAELAAIQAEMSAIDNLRRGEIEHSDTESLLEKITTEVNSSQNVAPLKTLNRLGRLSKQEYKSWERDWLDSIANYKENEELDKESLSSDEETNKCFSWRIMFPCIPGGKSSTLCGCDEIRKELRDSRRRSKSVSAPKKRKTRRGQSLSRYMED